MDDELRKGGVKQLIRERELLCERLLDIDFRIARASRRHERLGGIDGSHGSRSHPRNELGRERTGATTDVEHSLTA